MYWSEPNLTSRTLGSLDRVLLLGLGDTARGDEGVGVRAVEELARLYLLPPNVQTVMTTSPDLDVLDAMEEVAFVLAVDAVYADGMVGTVFRVPLDEYARDAETPESLHEEVLLQTLGVLEMLDQRPEGVLLAVQIAEGKAGEGLSPAMTERLAEVVRAAVELLTKRGLKLERRTAG